MGEIDWIGVTCFGVAVVVPVVFLVTVTLSDIVGKWARRRDMDKTEKRKT